MIHLCMKEELMRIGFSENEARVYLELLRNNSVTTTFLAKRLNLHRGYIYEILDKLIEKGVVSSIKKNGKKHFEAFPPNEILAYIEEQKSKIKSYESDFKKILPDLNKIKESGTSKQKVLLFEGKNALKSIFEDILQCKEELFVFGASGKFPAEMEPYYSLWNRQRVKNRISLNIIYNNKEIGMQESTKFETKFVNKKYLDFDKNNPTSVMLYSDKIAIIIWIEEPIITLIQSKEANAMYKRYFDTFWKQAKPI